MTTTRTVILAVNDLEARAIADMAVGQGCRIVALQQRWGEPLDPDRIVLEDLTPTVILVELPHPAFEERLRARGHNVLVVDHHLCIQADGSVLDRRHALASLEQVATLLGVPLNPRQRVVAANDRDFIPGIAAEQKRAGGSMNREALCALRLAELDMRLDGNGRIGLDAASAWLRGAQATGHLAVLDTGRRVADDPRLILLRVPEMHRECLADALYLWAHDQDPDRHPLDHPLEFLAVFTTDSDAGPVCTGLMFSGTGRRLDLIREIVAAPGEPWARLTRWAGGGRQGSFFFASDNLGGETKAVDALADRLLDELLTGNRPLVSWRSHFLQALRLEKGMVVEPPTSSPWKRDEASPEQQRYFLEHVRDLLVPGESANQQEDADLRLRSYVWKDPGLGLWVRIPAGETAGKLDVTVPVRAVRVHLLLERLAVVEWECAGGLCGYDTVNKIAYKEANRPGYWRQLLDLSSHVCKARPEDRAIASVAQLLDFNWAVRFCASPYINPADGAAIALVDADGKVQGEALQLGGRVSKEDHDGAFAALLEKIGSSGLPLGRSHVVFDERARVVTGLAGVGGQPCTADGREAATVILARLATVDAYGTSHVYDADFARRELEAATYDRFAAWGTRYAITEQSFVMLAHGDFAARFILPRHLPGTYRRMMLIATFYAAALNGFALETAELSRRRGGLQGGEFRELRQRFVRFANGLWFENVTSQLQGRELFARIRDAAPIAEEYAELKAKIDRTDELLDSIKADRWQTIGGGGLILAVTTGFLGMNLLDGAEWTWWEKLGVFLLVLGVTYILLRGALWVLPRWRSKGLRWNRTEKRQRLPRE